MATLLHVTVDVTAELGRCTMALGDVLQLGPGAVVALDRSTGSPVDLYVNEKLIARGELISIDDQYGVRITELLSRTRHPP